MKGFLSAAAAAVCLMVGASQAVAGNHSGPEASANGSGSVSAPSTVTTPIVGCGVVFAGICFLGFIGTTTTTTTTSEDFSFSAKAGPQTLTPLDPTDGPFGTMRLTYHQTVTVTTAPTGPCVPFPGFPCPVVPSTNTTQKNADVTAEVTCLNVVNNTAAIGGHVIKFSGDFTPTRGLLFNGVDNTVARQQVSPDLFDAAFLPDAPQVCPAPSGGHPITSGDVYVDQS